MNHSLVHAYLPLLLWPGLGFLLFRFMPDSIPRLMGRGLYWVGIPLEILALARQTQLAENTGLAPVLTGTALLLGLLIAIGALLSLRSLATTRWVPQTASETEGTVAETAVSGWEMRSRQGSFLISSMLGNTGFVGIAIAPAFVSPAYLGWIVFYSVTQNVIGTYGLGVLVSSYFGRADHAQRWWRLLWDVLTVPSLWAFVIGYATRPVPLPPEAETALHASVWLVIPTALTLMGMRISQLQGWESLRLALVPTAIKMLVVPALMGLLALSLRLPTDARLSLVLMSGMPCAFAGLILAEEYELDRELIASSIVLSTGLLLLTLPLWLVLFG